MHDITKTISLPMVQLGYHVNIQMMWLLWCLLCAKKCILFVSCTLSQLPQCTEQWYSDQPYGAYVHTIWDGKTKQDNKSSLVFGTAPNFNCSEICVKIFLQIYYVKIACKEDNQPVCIEMPQSGKVWKGKGLANSSIWQKVW